jgi:hypothetical protein
LAARNKFYSKAYWAGILVYAAYAVYKFFCQNGVLDWMRFHNSQNIAETMKANAPWVEETREFFGLVILIFVLLADWLYGRKKIIVR